LKQFGIELNLIVETQISLNDFNSKFIKWIESNGWSFGGSMRAVDEDGKPILKQVKIERLTTPSKKYKTTGGI
jgi:hypothetical protein